MSWLAPEAFSRRLWTALVGFALLLLAMHGVVYVISPIESPYDTRIVWFGFVVFTLAFAAVFFLVAGLWRADDALLKLTRLRDDLIHPNALPILSLVALVGLAAHVYAKYYLTTIRPISCLFEIRFVWMEISHDMLPAYVRIASVAGHLLSSFSYAGVFLASWLMTARAAVPGQKLLGAYLATFIFVGTVYAGFIGSRNVMLAVVLMNVCGVLVGLCSISLNRRNLLRAFLILALPSLVGLGFSTLVFSDRILCGAGSRPAQEISTQYVSGFLDELPIQWRAQAQPAALAPDAAATRPEVASTDLLNEFRQFIQARCTICVPTFLYVNHGLYNFAKISADPERGTPILPTFAIAWLAHVGIDLRGDVPAKRVFGSGGIGLVGAAYHDLGWMGVVGVGLGFGLMLGVALMLLRAGGRLRAAFGMTLLVCCFYTLALSSMFIGPNVIAFPFIAFSMFLTFALLPLLPRLRAR